ncbi:MAG: response regulator [Myxococcota bacterium]
MTPCRVLVVEDNPINQLVIRTMLGREGIDVHMAGNGAEGVERAQEGNFDLVLMDLQMPVMDGFEATRRIRQLPGLTANVPIVAVTANTLPADRRHAEEAGMDDFIAKPVRLGVLRTALERWLGCMREKRAS